MLKYLIYISSAVELMGDAELEELLKVSRGNNKTKNVTGMLLYSEGSFIQVLEGEKDDVIAIYSVIKAGKRHKNVTTIMNGDSEERSFPDWQMGFFSVNKETLGELEGYVDPYSKNFLKNSSAQPAILVLKTFAETNKRYLNV
jgi:hypothetical protein